MVAFEDAARSADHPLDLCSLIRNVLKEYFKLHLLVVTSEAHFRNVHSSGSDSLRFSSLASADLHKKRPTGYGHSHDPPRHLIHVCTNSRANDQK